MTDVVVHQTTATCVIASWGPLTISVWRGPINVDDLDAVAKFSEGVTANFPDANMTLSIVSTSMKPPDDAAKKKITELRKQGNAPGLKGSVVILAGDGFWASVMRSMLAGLNLVGGMKNETYLRTVSEAAALVHERIPSVDAADLERAIAKLCAESGVKV